MTPDNGRTTDSCLQLIFGYWQGFFMLFNPPIYAWWLSVGAVPLNISWVLHNVIAWMKLRPFLNKTVSRLFIGTIILSIPYWIVEIYANFAFFHNINNIFLRTRPWEALCRDPWWIAAAIFLIYNIVTKYDLTLVQIVRISPRFAVMLVAMLLSIAFIILDVLSVTEAFQSILPVGINPFWKLSFVFKCLTDSVVLDDFKTALDRLRAFKISRLGSFAVDNGDERNKEHQHVVFQANNWSDPPPPGTTATHLTPLGSPEGDYINPDRWNKGDPESNHVESSRPEVFRQGSRDRDIDENGIKVIDHAERRPETSDTTQLSHHDTWSNRISRGSSDPDIEYAMAIREMNSSSRPSDSIGLAR